MERNIKLFSWLNFFTDFIPYAPIAIIYFANVSGSYALGMSVFSVVMLASAALEIPTGIFSDKIGRKNTFIAGAATRVISAIFYAIGGSYSMLIVGALLEGLSRSFYSGNNDALFHDSLTQIKKAGDFHTHYGKTHAMFQVGLAISALLGGLLAQWSFALVMWVSVIPQLITLVLGLFLTEPSIYTKEAGNIFAHLKESIQQFRANKILQYLSITSILKYALGEASYLFRSAFVITLWPVWAIGFANMLSNIGGAVSFYFSGKVIAKFGSQKVLTLEIFLKTFINFVALLFPSIISPALMSLTSLTYGIGSTATNLLLQKHFAPKQRATMGSLNSFVGSIAFGIFAIVLGKFGDAFGPRNALILTQVLLLTPLLFYRVIFKKEKLA